MSASTTNIPWGEDSSGHDHATPDAASLSQMESILSYSPPATAIRKLQIMAAIGGLAFLVGLLFEPQRVWASVLMSGMALVSVALCGLFFVALQYVSGAGWAVVLRRIPEALTALLPVGFVGVGLVLVLYPSLYEWSHPEAHLSGFKAWWLTYSSLLLRAAIYAVGWFLFSKAILGNSRAQDRDGGMTRYRRNVVLSSLFIPFFALSYWLASVDWVMSLEPHWFSTIYGVYHFSGLFISGLAVIVLVVVYLQKTGAVSGAITENHLQDLGKLLLGFTTFWAYIWFSQYMLIWYADIPEETGHYIVRTSGTWASLFTLNPILNWVVPFFALLPRASKRSGTVMTQVAVVVLLGRWLDLYVFVYPSFAKTSPVIGIWEVGIAVGAVGLAGWVILNALKKAPLIPLKDPLLEESLHHHQ